MKKEKSHRRIYMREARGAYRGGILVEEGESAGFSVFGAYP
jgi:hypothetical protein